MIDSQLKRLLHADDEADIRDIVRHALQETGPYTVHSCASGDEVLESVEAFNPQMLLLDLTMRPMSGSRTVKALRERDLVNFDEVALVFFATDAETANINEFIRMGAADIIIKPFDSTSLAEYIDEIWQGYLSGRT